MLRSKPFEAAGCSHYGAAHPKCDCYQIPAMFHAFLAAALPPDPAPEIKKLRMDSLPHMVEVERLGRHYSDAEGAIVLEIRTGRLQTIIEAAMRVRVETYARSLRASLLPGEEPS